MSVTHQILSTSLLQFTFWEIYVKDYVSEFKAVPFEKYQNLLSWVVDE